MFQRLANGWELAKESWGVLRQDKELLVFPLVSGICCLFVLASFLLPLWGLGVLDQYLLGDGDVNAAAHHPLTYLGLFLFYWANYFVIVFFNSALVGCAVIRFRGDDPTLADGFRAAGARLPQILGWSFVSATVGMILKAIESRSEKFGEIAAGLLGAAWSIATYFVIPVIVIEKAGPIESLKRSTSIVRQTWGESLGANFGIGFITFLATIPGVLLICGGASVLANGTLALGGVLLVLGVLWMIVTSLISSALHAIILAALYLYAADGTVPGQFNAGILEGAFTRRR